MRFGFALAMLTTVCVGCMNPVDEGLDAELVAEAEEPILQDPACDDDSLWLYDAADGSGNRICFDEPGALDLRSYCRVWGWGYNPYTRRFFPTCTSRWAGNVRSYLPGRLSGTLSVPQTGVDQGQLGCGEWFNNDNVQGFTAAGACGQQASVLTLDYPIF